MHDQTFTTTSKRRLSYLFMAYAMLLAGSLALYIAWQQWPAKIPCVNEAMLAALPVGASESEIIERFGKPRVQEQADGTRHLLYIECFSGGFHEIELGADGKFTGRFDHLIGVKRVSNSEAVPVANY